MKHYMITSKIFERGDNWVENYMVHENVGGGAYRTIWEGTKNNLAAWLKENNVTDYGYGI